MPNLFKNEYKAVSTPGDGSCLYHMFSLCFFSDTKHMVLFRLLCMISLYQNRDFFLEIIKNRLKAIYSACSSDSIKTMSQNKFEILLLESRKIGQWANEYHILALSIILDINIFIYNSFDVPNNITSNDLLKKAFDNRTFLGNHLIYTKYENNTSVINFICGYFDSISKHYTAILPTSVNSLEYRPISNIFNGFM